MLVKKYYTKPLRAKTPDPNKSSTSCGSVAGLNFGKLLRKAQAKTK